MGRVLNPRNGMGSEVGGGSGWGTHVHPWLIHVNVWQKPPKNKILKKKSREVEK